MGDWLPISFFSKKSDFQEQITDIKWEIGCIPVNLRSRFRKCTI